MRSSIVRGVFQRSSTAAEETVVDQGDGEEGKVTPPSAAAQVGSFALSASENRLTFLHGGIVSGRVGLRALRAGGRSGRLPNSLVPLARLNQIGRAHV